MHLWVGMNFRYLSTSQRIRDYAGSGELGALSHGQFTYLRHRDGHRDDLNDYVMSMLHPLLLEQSIHHFDLIRYCYRSEVEALVADSWRPSWSTYEGDCCASVLFQLENGARVSYLGTWTASSNAMSFTWRSDFERGVLIQRQQFEDLVRIDFRPELGLSGPRFKTPSEAEPTVVEELEPCTAFVDDSRLLLSEFNRAVRGQVEPTTTGRDHVRSLCLVHGCVQSIESRQWVKMDEVYESLGVTSELL
jgi:predicted dehydrogenase